MCQLPYTGYREYRTDERSRKKDEAQAERGCSRVASTSV